MRKNKNTEKINVEKVGNLFLFSHFYIWDETLLLSFPLHVPSTLSSPFFSSLVFDVSLKLCATQAQELF
jgi:hypothetical protein